MKLVRNLAFGVVAAATVAIAPLSAQTLPGDFGGSGIPTSPIVQSTFGDFTLALSATQYKENAAGSYNGAGVFGFAAGYDVNSANRARWNFDYAIFSSTGVPVVSSTFTYLLSVSFEPTAGGAPIVQSFDPLAPALTDVSVSDAADDNMAAADAENSENDIFFGYDPNATGTYTIELEQLSGGVADGNDVSIEVVTSTPEPASMALMATGLIGVGGLVRRRRKAAK